MMDKEVGYKCFLIEVDVARIRSYLIWNDELRTENAKLKNRIRGLKGWLTRYKERAKRKNKNR